MQCLVFVWCCCAQTTSYNLNLFKKKYPSPLLFTFAQEKNGSMANPQGLEEKFCTRPDGCGTGESVREGSKSSKVKMPHLFPPLSFSETGCGSVQKIQSSSHEIPYLSLTVHFWPTSKGQDFFFFWYRKGKCPAKCE